MMSCNKCSSERIVHVNGKTSDCCMIEMGEEELDGYVPHDMGIGGGDYIQFSYCLDCGQIQDDFPIPPTKMEETDDE